MLTINFRFFGDIDEQVKKIAKVQGSQSAKSLSSHTESEDREMAEYRESPATKWVGERMRNGNRSMTASGKGKDLNSSQEDYLD